MLPEGQRCLRLEPQPSTAAVGGALPPGSRSCERRSARRRLTRSAAVSDADTETCRVDASTVEIPAQALEEPGDPRPSPKRARVDDAPAAAEPEPAAAPAPELDAATVKKMTVAKLRAALAARGLDTKGLKAALQARLLEAIAS